MLIDTTGIPVVLVGTLNSRSVLDANEQLRRRFGIHERLDPFRWDEEGESQFRRFFAASRGTIAGVMKIVRKATHLAIDHNLPRLELPLLARVFAEDALDEDTPNPFLDAPPPNLSGPPPSQQRAVSRRLQGGRESAMPSFSAS